MTSELERKLQAGLDEAQLTRLLTRLVQAPSVSGEEAPAVHALAEFLEGEGLRVAIEEVTPGRPNLVTQVGTGEGPTLLLTGHSDTVPVGEGWTKDPFGAAIENGRLYGRGSCDMKAGLAGMALALVGLHRSDVKPKGTVIFAACVDEEVSGIGTQAAIKAGLAADWAVIGEPTDLQAIRACKGNAYFEVEVTGKAAHAGAPERGVNAIYGAAEAIRAAQRHLDELATKRHDLLGKPTLSVGQISGGFTVSAVPDRCTLWVDRRLIPGESGEAALAEFDSAIRRHAHPPAGCEHRAHLRMELPPSEVPDRHPLVAALTAAARANGAPPLPVGGWTAASDGGYLMRDAGIPTVLFGPGSILNQAHRPDEFVPLDETVIAARTYMTLAARAFDGSMASHLTKEEKAHAAAL
ncbi:MAG TPA: M20 family metallopeptidase [Kiloniellales bacterium]|nr:M20 family metallopeptidase [Kiloniellales bacterium]